MPVLSVGHAAYWNRDTAGPPPVTAAPVSGYPLWQSAIICTSGFAALEWGLRHVRHQVWAGLGQVGRGIRQTLGLLGWWARWAWFLWRWRETYRLSRPASLEAVVRLPADRARVLLRVIEALQHPAYAQALMLVHETAQTLGFNRPEAWIPYSHALKASTRQAENVFRHLRVVHELSTALTNPERHLLAELAYQQFAAGTHFRVTH